MGRQVIRLLTAAMTVALVAGLMASTPASALAALFTVNSTGDTVDANIGDGVCDVDSGTGGDQCTLRAAIQEANVTPGADTINFNVSGLGCVDGVCTISPSTELPIITDQVIINGYTQGDGTTSDNSDDARENTLAVGNNAELKIKLDGEVLDGAVDTGNGLKIEADNSTVKGLVISNWDNGIFLGVDATSNTVLGNFIGTDASGSNLSNNIGVALTNALNNSIGGTTAGARNIISGNGLGISISGGTGNKIQGDYIGTNAAGNTRLGNNQGLVLSNTPNNTIGGTTAAERNIISGNGTWGVLISDPDSTDNKVQGNYIGTDVTGTVTDPDGTPNNGDELGNGLNGVVIRTGAANNIIGGTKVTAGNVISGNGISGSNPSFNTLSGVEVQFANSDLPNAATGNRILSNSIYDNARLGIDLYYTNDSPGVTCNDDDDGDGGNPAADPPDPATAPNRLQNFPKINSARLTTKRIGEHRRKVTTIKGMLNSTPSTATTTQTFTLQFFGSPEADDTPSICGPARFGEGRTFLGQKSVTTNKDGVATFTFQTRKKVPKGQVVTATATNKSTGDTSEFSEAVVVS